ncbi:MULTISPECIES: glycosyltransferase family 8 protein [Frankia]|uniref:glycosyltransferase family 8 protein n=1 Tax=Frankia TaxID=1854 RepID=UPI002118FFED|nr:MULTISPECIES: glycosyltransferase family 8 protein [Frankia]
MSNPLTPIVCCLDDRYARPLCVLMESLNATGAHSDVQVLVLHDELAAASRERVRWHADRLSVNIAFHQVVPSAAGPVSGWVSAAVYLRLAIGDTLGYRGRVLYLDVDTLVLADLRPLLLASLEGAAIGAVRDPQNPVIGAGIALPGWAELGLPAGRDYFNSGVMLLDLPACERQEVFSRARGFLADHPEQARLWDQDALNVAVDDQWCRLDRRWNTFALSPLAAQPTYRHDDAEPYAPLAMLLADEPDASILHFAGPAKPWREGYPPGRPGDLYRQFLRAVEEAESDGR